MRIAVAIAAILAASPVSSHEWYPTECCGGSDCKPVSCDVLHEEEHGGISYSPGGSHYVFQRERVRPSQDAKCHVCIHKDSPACVFIQQGS